MSDVPRSIILFGSSSAYGKVDEEYQGFAGHLRRWHEGLDVMNKFYNLGIPGGNVQNLLDRIEAESKPRNPGHILIQLGINDSRRLGASDAPVETPPDVYADRFKRLLTISKTIAPTTVVSVYPIAETRTSPVSWRNVHFLEEDARKYGETMKRLSKSLRVPYVDVFEALEAEEDYAARFLFKDGLHVNSAGHRFIFERIKEQLERTFDLQ